MCVGFTHGYDDFSHSRQEDALNAMVPGSAVSFNRIGYYHFAIFLGWAWPKDGNSDPIPLLCHLSGSMEIKPMASVRLDDFRDIVQKSQIRVYKCNCSSGKRSEVIFKCLWLVGKTGYNLLTKNCEHFVREVIDSQDVSYQAVFAIAAPLLQLPRFIAGAAVSGAVSSSASLGCLSTVLENGSSLGLISPDLDLIEIFVTNQGLNVKGIKKNSCCTKEFAGRGSSQFPVQKLFSCRSCDPEGQTSRVCVFCRLFCHKNCDTVGGSANKVVCSCNHAAQADQSSPIMCRIRRARMDRTELGLPPEFQTAQED